MNEHRLQRLLRRVLSTAPLPLAVLGTACGGVSTEVTEGNGGASDASTSGGEANDASTSGGEAITAGASSGGDSSDSTSGGEAITAGASSGGDSSDGGASAGAAGAATGGVTGIGCTRAAPPSSTCRGVMVTVPQTCLGPGQTVNAALPQAICDELCPLNAGPGVPVMVAFSCQVGIIAATELTVFCQPHCAVGRRPQGMGAPGVLEGGAAGDYFAQMAELEAASVTAFRILRDELRAVGAPKSLLRAAGRAARDEVRHARTTGALARRFGGTPRPRAVARGPLRSIEAMAIENAVEGCVRETYGALLATYQAEHARDPEVRAAMLRIARDETQHASLSWRVGRWLEARLDPTGKQNVDQAKTGAVRELQLSLASEPPLPFAEAAGLPTPEQATQLANELHGLLWS